MSPIVISWIIFACVFGGALLGMLLRKLLPEHHLDADSKSVVNLGMALIGTMSALVLGLLIASAKSSFDAQRSEFIQMSANVIQLDRILARYGPETKEARDVLRRAALSLDQNWFTRCESIEGVIDLALGHGGGVAIVIVEPGDVVDWYHQIPADQGERGGVARLHVHHLAEAALD